MAIDKHERLRVRILVKAFPQPSEKHEETVCCAGITEDGQRLLRLFPIRFRRLPAEQRFGRFDLVELVATKAPDPRPESYRVDESSIRLVEHGGRLTDASRLRLWSPFIAPSLRGLYAENLSNGRSLGIIKPDPGSVHFFVKPAKQASAADLQIAEQVRHAHQASLLEAPLVPLEKPDFAFEYEFKSNAHSHGPMMIHDWEVQETHRQYKRRYGDDCMEHMRRMYGNELPARNLHLIMGTMLAHPRTFIIIGLLRSGLDPEELNRQGALF